MASHFLLSAAARTLSLKAVATMSDEEARATFTAIRWSDNGGQPYCPKCGCLSLYTYKARKIWKCKGCTHQFSATSGTIFASHKLPIRDYLMAIALFVNGAKHRDSTRQSEHMTEPVNQAADSRPTPERLLLRRGPEPERKRSEHSTGKKRDSDLPNHLGLARTLLRILSCDSAGAKARGDRSTCAVARCHDHRDEQKKK